MLVNTEYFREAAKYYDKHARYDDGVFGTLEYERFWHQEIKRCKEGYKVGDTWISGYHYFYLNYWRIMKVSKTESGLIARDERNTTNKEKGERVESFPDFWDVDFEFFQEVEKAEVNGEHMVWLKPRGVGASWKGASMAGRNIMLFKKSKSFMVAYEKEYLQKDGLLTKFKDGREFLLKAHPYESDRFCVGFAKPSDFKKAFEDMYYRASSKHPDTNDEIGFMSEVMGISVRDDPDKPRGKRGKLILLEEMGKFPKVDSVWNIMRSSVEEQNVVYGLMLGFGTGGTENADFAAFERMFYNPKAYNIRAFDNIYDDNMYGTQCAYFSPAYKTIQFKDKNGNSDTARGKAHIKDMRKEASLSPDPNALLQNQAEHPEKPQEAILSTGYRILPSAAAKEHRVRVQATGAFKLGIPGILVPTDQGVKFKPGENKHPPLIDFPPPPKSDLTGCLVIYHAPYRDKDTGKVPDNLYIISHDPYAQDASTGESVGATHVYMNPNNLVPPGDKIVATWIGRPPTQDDYNELLFLLSEYYNAMIGFENDQGDVVGYAKRFRKLDRLFPEFECGWDESVKTKNSKRSYGMHIGSGRENKRKLQGDKYLAEWLNQRRGQLANGDYVTNLQTINCLYTLREIELYNLEGNFDACSSLRVLMYFRKEQDYKGIQIVKPQVYNPNSIFGKKLY